MSCVAPKLSLPETVESKSVLPVDFVLDMKDLASANLMGPVLELIRRASSRLPQDVVDALVAAREKEEAHSRAWNALNSILENIVLADGKVVPICQDTGTLILWIRHPFGLSQHRTRNQIRGAVAEATRRVWLRPNCVSALQGKNTGTNLEPFGAEHPILHFEEWEKEHIHISLMLKGGGCENVGAQYRLPDAALGAGRDLGGVRKCVLDAVHKAQGQGCSPGILGVAIGGDRVSSYEKSKALLLRKLGHPNPDPGLGEFEAKLLEELNSLGIGPMGYGGRSTLLGLAVEEMYRHPASFFVSISYMCWASRRQELHIGGDGRVSFD